MKTNNDIVKKHLYFFTADLLPKPWYKAKLTFQGVIARTSQIADSDSLKALKYDVAQDYQAQTGVEIKGVNVRSLSYLGVKDETTQQQQQMSR